MKKPHHNIVIAGDVDHGKSTMIGRLLLDTKSLPDDKLAGINRLCQKSGKRTELAYLTDQLKEERDGSMTIDTAQTLLKTRNMACTLIDAPGHVEFLKNMLTGAAQADAAILIIDINQDIQEQTRRHACLLHLLGIKNIIVGLNKIDIAKQLCRRFTDKRTELLDILRSLDITPICVIPVSAAKGINVIRKNARTKWYHGPCLIQAIEAIPTKATSNPKPLRLPVQDIYTIKDKKIIVGQIDSGHIAAGQKISILPALRKAAVRSIEIFGKSPRKASTGESIGVRLDPPARIKRGDVICGDQHPPLTARNLSGELFWLGTNALKANDAITINCATQSMDGRIKNIENLKDPSTMQAVKDPRPALHTHELARVSFTLKDPLVFERTGAQSALGRFTITQGGRLQGLGVFN